MKATIFIVLALAWCVVLATEAKTEGTMAVARCQAVQKDGVQCPHQAEDGGKFCWRHRGFVKAVNDSAEGTSKGAAKAWENTKDWSTNAWQKTKSGAQSAWEATKEAADDMRVGLVKMLGGKDDKKDKEKKQ